MPRRKKMSSSALDIAAARAAGAESIDHNLDLGNNLNLQNYRSAIADAMAKLSTYNTLLSQADEAKSKFEVAERAVRDYSERMLAGIAARFGKDSDAYAKAGGTKKSEHRHHDPKTPAQPAAAPTAGT